MEARLALDSKMKENFNQAFKDVLVYEGGYVNDPDDPGGMTNMGITAKTLAEFTGRRLSTITEKEMRSLTKEQVMPIYKRKYWDACKCDQIPAGLDTQVFDFAVNSGPARAIKELQKCLRVEDDGVLGPVTLKHISTFPLDLLIREYAEARRDFLRNLKTFQKFGKGWIARVDKVETKATQFV